MNFNPRVNSFPGKRIAILTGLIICGILTCISGFPQTGYNRISSEKESIATKSGLAKRFECFEPVQSDAFYFIELCADLPDNNNPKRIRVGDETGHVFIILSKQSGEPGGTIIEQSFGFYPRRPASSLIFKNVRPEILDNRNREYNVCLARQLTPSEFEFILEKAKEFSMKKYNINRFNCYDYALAVFNSLPGIEKITARHIKFPFVLGYGGSPCGLYEDLLQLKANGSSWARFIHFGIFKSPPGCK